MSQQIHAIVETTWRQHIGLPPEWTTEQINSFLTTETATICTEIERRTVAGQQQALAQWAKATGREPDYLTTVGLINNLRNQVTEAVLTEALYEKIPVAPETPADSEPKTAVAVSASPDRWRDPATRTPEPDPDLDALADQLLPHRSTLVRVMAAHLLQTMREDGEPLPGEVNDPRSASFINRLEQGMRADRLPLDGPGALAAN
ncbi:hypothetical protein HLB23_24590 [Nocardia uniformis]|uniref:Uncharacterized protein n=1 Tax=Nocardia uniformis TaxID=53432 RepID=A0A849C9F3_9NOCA|nr:hypothetical protein [Nocardia uniformis]NNH73000.1 hypothetical protein [Nocardia uniformis]